MDRNYTLIIGDVDIISPHQYQFNQAQFIQFQSPNLHEICDHAFFHCSNFRTLDLRSTPKLSVIYSFAFEQCESLETVFFPESLVHIFAHVFSNCQKLTNLYFPSKFELESLGAGAFSFTNISSFRIPSTNLSIGIEAFRNCYNLKDIKLDSTEIFHYEDGVLFDSLKTILLLYLPSNSRTKYIIPETVQVLSSYSFAGSQVREVIFPPHLSLIHENCFRESQLESLEISTDFMKVNISESAFASCLNLRTADLSEIGRIHALWTSAFADCISLKTVYFPWNMYSVGAYTFANCINLEKVFIPKNSTLSDIRDHSFSNCTKLTSFYIPSRLSAIGNHAFTDSGIKNIIVSPLNTQFFVSNNTLYETKYDALVLYLHNAAPHQRVFYPSYKVKILRDACFYNALNLEKIIIPKTVTMIFKDAISHTGIKELVIPKSVYSIAERCFAFNDKLEYVEFRSRVNRIPINCFMGCKHLKNVNFFTTPLLRKDVFTDCNQLNCIYLGNNYGKIRRTHLPNRVLSEEKCPSNTEIVCII